MRREQEHAHGLQIVFGCNIAHGEEIARRLGHFLIVHIDVTVVHPVPGKGLAGRALGLRNFVLMVGEDQIHAAAVNIKGLAQIFHAHRRALDMPAGATHAPGALPCGLAGLLTLPERKIHWVALDVADLDASAGFQVIQILTGQLAVVIAPCLRIKIHVAVVRAIRQPLVFQLLNQRDNVPDVLRSARMHVGALHAQRLRVLEILGNVLLSDGFHRGALLVGAADHLIIDIGEILHEGHVIAQMRKKAAQRIEDHERARVADMEIIVNRWAAGIDTHMAFPDRHKRLLFAAKRIVNVHGFH